MTEFVQQDENNRRWLNDFRTKSYAMPISLESIDGKLYLINCKTLLYLLGRCVKFFIMLSFNIRLSLDK